jgi:ribonuclease E
MWHVSPVEPEPEALGSEAGAAPRDDGAGETVTPVTDAAALDGESGTGSPQVAADSAPQPVAPSPAPIGAAADMTPPAADVSPAESAPSATAAPGATAASGNAAPAAAAEPPVTSAAAEPPVTAAEAPATEPAQISPAAGVAAPGPEHDDPAHEASDPADEPHPTAPRAQPMVIEHETVSGPVETGADADRADSGGPDALTLAHPADSVSEADTEHEPGDYYSDSIPESPPPETVGGEPDNGDEQRERRPPSRYLRNYKIQEVIRRRQILLVQVVKEERGTKGAALTTYLSLAGRFSVLMPNSPRGGGISRKITSAADRRRLKEVIAELDMPRGMGLIVRTAGANRPKPEIKRDCEYLLRLWDDIREHTMKSVAPALIYEEASLIKRAIRDVYSRDIDEIQVDGEEGWKAAHEFMRMLMPSHAKKVQLWRDATQPLFTKHQVEAQLDGMLQPTVQLRSGGYLVINQTEALVAIDVNSGRSTRERNVEETALRTNLEAVDEVARQLRLRDLAGLIVIDLIDMEQKKHNAMVERRIKEALKNDRARIQVGHISHFGLLEMSRQRLRPSLAEASFILCPHCGGTGHVRSTENAAIHVLRGIEDEGSKRRSAEIVVHAATPIALYILNHKRDRLIAIEQRYAMRVTVMGDDTQVASQFRIDRVRAQVARDDVPAAITPDAPQPALPAPRWETEEPEDVVVEDEDGVEEAGADEAVEEENGAGDSRGESMRAEATETAAEQAERRRRRRRRRRGGGRREDGMAAPSPAAGAADGVLVEAEPAAIPEPVRGGTALAESEEAIAEADTHIEGVPEHAEPIGQAEPSAEDDARRRRGRRGGRRRRREPGEGEGSPFAAPGAEQPDLPPVYIGPTPANPFGGHAFDIFDVLEQVEASAAVRQEPQEPVARQPLPVPGAEVGSAEPTTVAPAEPTTLASAEPATVLAPAEPEGVAPGLESLSAPEGRVRPLEPAATATPRTRVPAEVPATASTQEPAAASTQEPAAASAQEPAAASAQEIVNATAPEPAAADSLGERTMATAAPVEAPAAPAAEPEAKASDDAPPAEVANDVAPEPAIRPIIIGSGEEPAEKKRGWWRR